MRRKTFARMNCSIARALELIGEWWTMLILREAFLGTRRFHDFQCNLGIARNILSARLKKLVARWDSCWNASSALDGGRRLEYRLTDKGRVTFFQCSWPLCNGATVGWLAATVRRLRWSI